jgi:hypothetical protein
MDVRKVAACLVAATISIVGLNAEARAKGALPEAYVGVWMNLEGRAASCSSSDWDGPNHMDTHVRVAPGHIQFHEGSCEFTSVDASEYGDARVMMQCGAEGDVSKETEIWALRTVRDHQMLITTNLNREAGATIVYQHCP